MILSGAYGYPKEQAIRIVADATQQFSCKHEMTVYFVFFDKGVSQIGKSWLHNWGKTPDTIFIANLLRCTPVRVKIHSQNRASKVFAPAKKVQSTSGFVPFVGFSFRFFEGW